MDTAIDTNYLRKPKLDAALQSAPPADRFILADTASLETLKNAQWELTARKSFEIISRYPDKISTATELSKLMKQELDSGKDTTDVLDAQLTPGFKQLLKEIASGTDGPAMAHVRAQLPQAQTSLMAQQQNHPQNLASLKAAFDSVKRTVDLAKYRKLPDEATKRQFRLRFAKTLAQMATKDVAVAEGKGVEIGDALAAGRGAMLRLQIGFFLLGFKWAINNGLSSFPDTKATNEIMDLDHAIIATYCDCILTEESSVQEMRQDILDALDAELLQLSTPSPGS